MGKEKILSPQSTGRKYVEGFLQFRNAEQAMPGAPQSSEKNISTGVPGEPEPSWALARGAEHRAP